MNLVIGERIFPFRPHLRSDVFLFQLRRTSQLSDGRQHPISEYHATKRSEVYCKVAAVYLVTMGISLLEASAFRPYSS